MLERLVLERYARATRARTTLCSTDMRSSLIAREQLRASMTLVFRSDVIQLPPYDGAAQGRAYASPRGTRPQLSY
jgi:hypothetical protein